MEWNIDVHKYLSEITRTALKVIVDFGVTSASDNDLITKAEHKMADLGVYKSKEAAEGQEAFNNAIQNGVYSQETYQAALAATNAELSEMKQPEFKFDSKSFSSAEPHCLDSSRH